jgi:hypothetical protein
MERTESVDEWLLPIIQSLAHRALPELEYRLKWVVQYLADNARPARNTM